MIPLPTVVILSTHRLSNNQKRNYKFFLILCPVSHLPSRVLYYRRFYKTGSDRPVGDLVSKEEDFTLEGRHSDQAPGFGSLSLWLPSGSWWRCMDSLYEGS